MRILMSLFAYVAAMGSILIMFSIMYAPYLWGWLWE